MDKKTDEPAKSPILTNQDIKAKLTAIAADKSAARKKVEALKTVKIAKITLKSSKKPTKV